MLELVRMLGYSASLVLGKVIRKGVHPAGEIKIVEFWTKQVVQALLVY